MDKKLGECVDCKSIIDYLDWICQLCITNRLTNKQQEQTKKSKLCKCGNRFSRKERKYSKFCSDECKNKYRVIPDYKNLNIGRPKGSSKEYKELKQLCVDLKGGKCVYCGYNKCLRALHFHHIDASNKKYTISSLLSRSNKITNVIEEELDKCILLCANCHSEIHDEL